VALFYFERLLVPKAVIQDTRIISSSSHKRPPSAQTSTGTPGNAEPQDNSGGNAVMPMAGAGMFGLKLGMMAPVMTMMLHAIFGAVLGGVYKKLT